MPDSRDLVVAILPRFDGSTGPIKTYDIVLYGSGEGVEGLFPGGPPPESEQRRFAGRLSSVGGAEARVLAAETDAIDLSRIQEAFGAYVESAAAPGRLHDRLRELLQPKAPLLSYLHQQPLPRGTRVWLHHEARELEEVPWELLVWEPRGDSRTVFFRGTPWQAGPLFELHGPLRRLFLLADPKDRAKYGAIAGAAGADFEPATRATLERARDYDVVHVAARATVGPTAESALVLQDGAQVPASQLARALFGSRVGLLLLSPPDPEEVHPLGAETYRAFMHLCGEAFQCSIVAPAGPLGADAMRFWQTFHERLVRDGSVERALRAAREGRPVPVCFALRHGNARVFARPRGAPPATDHAAAVAQVETASTGSLAAQRRILEQTLASLDAIDRRGERRGRAAGSTDALALAKKSLESLNERFSAQYEPDEDEE